jgi:cytochrome c oxidase assembly factor CtaG
VTATLLLAHASGWTADLPVVAVLGAGVAYFWAVRTTFTRHQLQTARTVSRMQGRALAFAGGLLTVLVALAGPVEKFADELFWVHMVQHVLLLTVAAPLFVLAAPWALALRVLPRSFRRRAVLVQLAQRSTRLGRVSAWFATPAVVWVLFNANLLAWHVPAAFTLTLRNEPVHVLEHVLFLALGVLFWSQVIDSPLPRARLGDRERVVYIAGAAAVGWALSIALTLAPSPLYAGYAALRTRPGGLSALADQRLAAGVMLVPGSIAFFIAGSFCFMRWLANDERQSAVAPPPATRLALRTEQRGA